MDWEYFVPNFKIETPKNIFRGTLLEQYIAILSSGHEGWWSGMASSHPPDSDERNRYDVDTMNNTKCGFYLQLDDPNGENL
mmetsp:Transcript_36085/g.61529  ORF Transcript_36085/g.61529 Transcript_36085/m.61529 type:complete len:81 (-) Transcript_36085:245-487(-)